MSTDNQTCSIGNQMAVISEYAHRKNLTIIRAYTDEGKSGLKIDRRDALKQLLQDAQHRPPDFDVILVYDVSLWGRFQDSDEAAHYEFLCRSNGIRIEYCAEPFDNDGGSLSALMKNIKRTMAGEYSRELSVKTLLGQCRTAARGFLPGGSACFGMRRMLLGIDGRPKGLLQRGEFKSVSGEKVILVPGPPHEVATVRKIYALCLKYDRNNGQIAEHLNRGDIKTGRGNRWHAASVRKILTNEKYIGNLVFNRLTRAIGAKHRVNEPSKWIRHKAAFQAIVSRKQFDAVQEKMRRRIPRCYTDAELLGHLRKILARTGYLSSPLIKRTRQAPDPSTYFYRFGGLREAYRQVGYSSRYDGSFFDHRQDTLSIRCAIAQQITEGIEQRGGKVVVDRSTDLLTINETVTIAVRIAWGYRVSRDAWTRWRFQTTAVATADLTVVVRLDGETRKERDFYVLPRWAVAATRGYLLTYNGIAIDALRYECLSDLLAAAESISLARGRS